MRFLRFILFAFTIMFFSCNSPSDSNGKIVENSLLYEIDNYCYDVDINDNTIVLAASDGGYYKFSYTLDSDDFPVLEQVFNEVIIVVITKMKLLIELFYLIALMGLYICLINTLAVHQVFGLIM
tara:strand:- start:284 stop:655 length:372 start_codon:yes stop_codon:yes gene_type:complete